MPDLTEDFIVRKFVIALKGSVKITSNPSSAMEWTSHAAAMHASA